MGNKPIGSAIYLIILFVLIWCLFAVSQPPNQLTRVITQTHFDLPSNLWQLKFDYAVQKVNIELNQEGSNLNLYFYDPSGKLLHYDISGENMKQIPAGQLQINQTYYILVRGNTKTTYELIVSYNNKDRQENEELHFQGTSSSNVMRQTQNIVIDSAIEYPEIKLTNRGATKIQASTILLHKIGEEEIHFIYNCFELQQEGEISIDLYPMDQGKWSIVFESQFILEGNQLQRSELLVSLVSNSNAGSQLSQIHRKILCDSQEDEYFWWLAIVILAGMCCLPVSILIIRNCCQRARQRQIQIQQQSYSQRRSDNDNEPNRYVGLLLQFSPNKNKNKQQEQSKHWLQDQKSRNNQCPVCLQNNCNCELGCKHRFHMNCIVEWINKYKSCPYCRLRASKQQLRLLE